MELDLGLRGQPVLSTTFDQRAECVIIQQDTLEACRALPSNFFNLIVTSPPYNIGKIYEAQTTLTQYLSSQRDVITELSRLLAADGSLCWQVGNYVDESEVFPLDIYFYPLFKEMGLKLRNRIVWHFEHGLHASKRFSGRYETLLWFTKSDEYVFNLDSVRIPSKYPGKLHFKGDKRGQPSGNPLGKNPSDFWEFLTSEWSDGIWEIPNVKANHPEKTDHPCQFPVELVERCVLALTKEDDWVLDPFVGVGSSLIASWKHRRRSVGIDRDPAYCSLAKERLLSFHSGALKVRPLGKPVHTPSGREKVTQLPIQWVQERKRPYITSAATELRNETD